MHVPQGLNNIILFDGVCNLCSGAVTFIIKRDKSAQFKFASLQSETASNLLSKFNDLSFELDSIILIQNDKYYDKSTAILKVFKQLGGFWSMLYIFVFLPKSLRDYLYDIVARNRYGWFGKKEICMIPNEEIKDRFLE